MKFDLSESAKALQKWLLHPLRFWYAAIKNEVINLVGSFPDGLERRKALLRIETFYRAAHPQSGRPATFNGKPISPQLVAYCVAFDVYEKL